MFSKQKRDALLVRTYFNSGEYLSLCARLGVRLHRCSRILSHRGVWLEQRLPIRTCIYIYVCIYIYIFLFLFVNMLYFYIEYEFMTYTSFQVMFLLLNFLMNKDLSGWLL